MATGQPPFSGATQALVFDGILNRAVPPPSQLNPEISHDLDLVILGALEKKADLRVQSASELRAQLKRLMHAPAPPRRTSRRLAAGFGVAALVATVAFVAWILGARRGGPPAAETASIAVLPFADMSQAKDQEYFSDGLSEELLDVLAKIPQLRVIGRTSSFQFKGKNEDLRVIGRKLGVDHLLEGSVRKEGTRVRVIAQLIKARDGSHLWSQTYERTLDDVFQVQDEIAGSVAQAMRVTLLSDGRPGRSVPASIEAHNSYLEGRYFAERRTKDDYDKAIAAFQKTLVADPQLRPGVGRARPGLCPTGGARNHSR